MLKINFKQLSLANFQIKKSLSQLILLLIIFFAPINLFFQLAPQNAYFSGLRIDYFIPKLFLTDILILFFLSLNSFFIKEWRLTKNYIIGFALIALLLLRTFFTINPLSSFSFVVHLLIYAWFMIKIIENKYIDKSSLFFISIFAIFFQIALAFGQFILQRAIFPYFIFGESNIQQFAGIAKGIFFSRELSLPYGSTAHPNILAGSVAMFFVGAVYLNKALRKSLLNNWLLFIAAIFVLAILFLTQSFSASIFIFLAMAIFFLRPKINKINLSITFLVATILSVLVIGIASTKIGDLSLTRRHLLNLAAISLTARFPFFGVGPNMFVAYIESVTDIPEAVRFLQPAHNVFLLILSEWGIVGCLASYYLWQLATKKINYKMELNKILIMLLPILLLDHYLITSQTGWLMFIYLNLAVVATTEPE